MKKKYGYFIMATLLLLAAIGLVVRIFFPSAFAGSQLETVLRTWWPVLVLVLGIGRVIRGDKDLSTVTILLVGTWLTLKYNNIIPTSWHIYIWPAMFVALAIILLSPTKRRKK